MTNVNARVFRFLAAAMLVGVIAACGDDDDPTGPRAGDAVLITSGVAVTGIAGAEGSLKLYKIVVPAGATELEVATSGGTGDADLWVRFNAVPTFDDFDCSSEGATNDEICTQTSPQAGTWFILIEGWEAYSGLTLTATVTTP